MKLASPTDLFFNGKITRPWYTAAVLGLCALLNFSLMAFDFDFIEALFYDARIRTQATPQVSGALELVAISQKTVQDLGRIPTASDIRNRLEIISSAQPRAIVVLINPEEIAGTAEELKALAGYMAKNPKIIVGVDEVFLKGDRDSFRLKAPFEKVNIGEMPMTSDKNIFARDDVTRRLMISYQGQRTTHATLAAMVNPKVATDTGVRGHFEFLGSYQAYIDYRPKNTYQLHDFNKVEKLQSQFNNKIVLLGLDTETAKKDYIRTPFSREINAMTTLEAHANILDTLILNSGPIRCPRAVTFVMTALISLIGVYAVLALKPTLGLAVIAAGILVFGLIGFALFGFFGIWVDLSHPLLAIFVIYYFFVPYRLIAENRRSWEYLQKNRLLVQVEELKTNFLRMMSHDLKTPIARIQGMTDIVLGDANDLSPRQFEAMKTLRMSADELLHFVSSILNLTRIESKEVKLHLHSKDINTIVSEVAAKYRDFAKQKHIKLALDLEPMFSIKLDPDLMRQVFTNLIENAIKYGSSNTTITIKTTDSEGRVRVSIADQGPGIPPDELDKIFSKFYRGRGTNDSAVKGSGLGLYLAQYFTELHQGHITVESEVGKGSTFTVDLPNDLQTEKIDQPSGRSNEMGEQTTRRNIETSKEAGL